MNEVVDQSISECRRCGTCCIQGGPSLHLEDKDLLSNGTINLEQLVTIRKGEMAHFPLREEPEPIERELIKIAGKGKEWECVFLEQDEKLCTIYENRPVECRLLECWNTSELENVAGKNTLTRADIIAPEQPISEFIRIHELKCPVPAPDKIRMALSSEEEGAKVIAELTELVHMDLAIRAEAVGKFKIPLPIELLYFGRPIHIILNAHGLSVIEQDGAIQIAVPDRKL